MSSALKKSKPNLIYALNANGKPVHIDSVQNGFSCGCRCPRCDSLLQAKNGGNERAHHFAHKDGADCVGAVESAIHCLAKEILKESLCVMLPDNAGELRFDKVETERNFPDLKLRPDCVGYYGGKSLWIEFKRTHEVDAHKAGKIISARIDCIEIDLKDCEQDKEILREFITQNSENRKWIYSSEYGVGLAEHAAFNRNPSKKDDSDLESVKLERHFAIDDGGKLIDFRVPSEFDAINHSYYCPNCGNEVVLSVDAESKYTFVHLEENDSCDDEMYLRGAAVFAIQKAFVGSKNFVIDIPQYRYCKQGDKCPYNQECRISTIQQYDLKSYYFVNCEKDYKFNDVSYRTDLVLFGESIEKDAIEVRINTENYENEIETPRRLIEITVHGENDICRLEKGLKGFGDIRFSNFAVNAKEAANPAEIEHDVWKYIIYKSGKIHIGFVKCTELHPSQNKSNVIKEGFFTKTNGVLEDMYIFLLLHYKNLQKELCYCQLCCYLKKTNGYGGDNICIRYKKTGTPKNPLKEKISPKECPYFRKNFDIKEDELTDEMDIEELLL